MRYTNNPSKEILAARLLKIDTVNRKASGNCPSASYEPKLDDIFDDSIF
jgi:hypothetical protein